jgi:hypothetical protein
LSIYDAGHRLQGDVSSEHSAQERKSFMSTYLTTAQAASILDLDTKSVRDLCRQGLLPGAIRNAPNSTWKIPVAAVLDWKERMAGSGSLSNSPDEAGVRPGTSISGDQIHISDSHDSIMAVGRGARTTVTQVTELPELRREFKRIREHIQTRPDEPDLDKEELANTVEQIEAEVSKQEQANPNKVERWLKFLAMMAPDVLEVVLAALTGPIPGITAAIRKVAERVKAGASKGSV